MKIRSILLAATATLLLAVSAYAGGNVTNIQASADGDGNIVCPVYTWSYSSVANIYGDQYGAPGHIIFDITSDTEQDPTLTLNNVIDNDTGFSWAGYQVLIYMNKTFTIPTAPLLNGPAGWGMISYTPSATFNGTEWVGQIDFSGTPPIGPGGQIDFTYQLAFAGSVRFTQELVPIAVPEPAACTLLLGGGLLAGLLARRQRR
jgi:hypothetical protein